VLNGFFEPRESEQPLSDASLAIVPSGTGNDLAQAISSHEPRDWMAHTDWQERRVDVGRATFTTTGDDVTLHWLSVSSFGVSARIAGLVHSLPKSLGPRLRYRLATVVGLCGHPNSRIRLSVDDDVEELLTVSMVAVANTGYFGAGMKIAPQARLDDGQLDVVTVGDVGLGTFARHSRALDRGDHVHLPFVGTHRGRVIAAAPLDASAIPVAVDGEPVGRLPATWRVIPSALRLVAPLTPS
jgi:diacylglycerol kinase family enzyme